MTELTDYISGRSVRSTPEEREAVQPFSRALVEDYGYPKSRVRTHPQWRVRIRPSDSRKSYPVDIAVFSSEEPSEDTEYILVECKQATRKRGRKQLETYLRMSRARLGVWFNGEQRVFIRKRETEGRVEFAEIPNLPRFGERLEDLGNFRRRDLRPTHNLRFIFRAIRNYWAANAVGITRDEVFAQQLIHLVFCKIYDERFTRADKIVRFRAGIDEDPRKVGRRLKEIFAEVKKRYSDVFSEDDELELDLGSLTYFVGEIQPFALTETSRDAVADAFEVFVSNALKGPQGQFFTPRNVVRMVLSAVSPRSTDRVIDPACGSGGFLIESLRWLWDSIEREGADLDWPEHEIAAEKQKVAIRQIRGIEKDSFLAKVAKAYMAILGDGRGGIVSENSLKNPAEWASTSRDLVPLGAFDIVVTNPPFGKKLKISDREILADYSLGHKWTRDSGSFSKTPKLHEHQPPQILFVERCLDLLCEGGTLGILVPESMLSNPSHRYIVQFLRERACIRAVISLPEELFQPYTHAKACVAVLEKRKGGARASDEIFMARALWCGHDSRGLPIPHDDIPIVTERYEQYRSSGAIPYDHLGFTLTEAQIQDNIYLPKYYDPEIPSDLEAMGESHDLVSIQSFIDRGVLEVTTGHEVGKLAYGTGSIPFIRTSDLANWEIKFDPKQGLSQEIYEEYSARQDVRENDILMVRDGTYLVGTCALVTRLDTKIVFQSHLYKIRSVDTDRLHPYLLLALLSCPIVTRQIYAKRFTQDIIDTLGRRISELVLPIPKTAGRRQEVVDRVASIVEARVEARESMREVLLSFERGSEARSEYGFFSRKK